MNNAFNFGYNAVDSQQEEHHMADQKKPITGTGKGSPANEPLPQKLARLANKRVNKAITQIRLIGNLGTYSPTQQQVDVICKAIDAEVSAMKEHIKVKGAVIEGPFKLA